MQSEANIGITAIYCRLSRDDGTETESNSIGNQKKMLTQKAKELGLTNTKYYVDDGYTGTNFNRPAFQELLDDIEMGYISVVIVKDLSRLGRDYVSVGHYTDNYFPEHNIRFIAVNDMVDSDEGENEIAPFKNVMNEMYARDISRKVRSAHRIRGNMGEPLSQPPYGYMKSPENKKKWIIDTEAAEVVRDIYRMCLDGMGNEAIARELQNRQVLIPMAYWQSKGLNRGGKKTQPNPYKWCKTTIQKILAQQEYCGDVINFKTYSKNFKNKTRIDNPVENWKIFKDVHEPIIDRDTWEMVQKHTARTKRRAPKKENARKHIFSGLIRCADCGSNMSYHTNTVNKDIHYFSCSNYVKDTRGTCQTRHYIRADALEQIVIYELKRLAIMLQMDEPLLVEILEKKSNKDFYDEKKFLEGELQKAIVRQQTVASLYEKLYEDNATGKVTDEWFTHMSHKYEVERAELKVKIFNLREKVANMQTVQHSKDMFIGAVRKFLDMEAITAPLVHELIDHIDVYEAEGKGKNKTQRVVIHYNFVGYLEIPENDEPCFTADTRQGVAIGYIAKPTEKSA
ncbi:TPA: recombinase family protein [Clostridioides difficile]|nr:recombinase family protein [Clostridioides difficile]HBY2902207.1 recombinase family protein [Clostridioides difficile]